MHNEGLVPPQVCRELYTVHLKGVGGGCEGLQPVSTSREIHIGQWNKQKLLTSSMASFTQLFICTLARRCFRSVNPVCVHELSLALVLKSIQGKQKNCIGIPTASQPSLNQTLEKLLLQALSFSLACWVMFTSGFSAPSSFTCNFSANVLLSKGFISKDLTEFGAS